MVQILRYVLESVFKYEQNLKSIKRKFTLLNISIEN